MQKRRLVPALALALVLPTALAGGMAGMPMGPVSTAQVTNDSDVLFMEVMTMVNLEEIQTGQLALKKSSNAEVRAFAQMVIADHTRAQAELNNLAAMKGVRLTNKPGADQRLQYNHLATLTGADFDAEYKKEQVSGHQMALDLIKTYRSIGKDAQVLAYAAKNQPVIASHLEYAKMLP
ncbi:DUF4142 domain-containing protein [Deinococcus metallilatus]|uniref:Membrane protein n=1 Tax=Deinococcus metallilatus TaxID=1211322 RepID=A0ABR6MZB1_9DEIO|nr:DUF4142 domain-containing protein [Deinococcus metallilatus]MBB5297009.1 putative membrane protein [Deinococcus metallilatus]GMA15975.1 hypothetical protein GCM10025871_23060 [Deinococcus metallilatus]